MSAESAPKHQLLRSVLALLVLLSGLCTIFASIVTAAEAWQEHEQARWPKLSARVDRCGMDQTSTGRREGYYIECRLNYVIGAEENVTRIYSRTVPGPKVWQYPPSQIGPFGEWLEAHPPGTPIIIRYNPANHTKVVLVNSDMPGAGPRTAGNIKQIEFWGASFLILFLIVRVAKPRSTGMVSVDSDIAS